MFAVICSHKGRNDRRLYADLTRTMTSLDVHEIIARPSLAHLVMRDVVLIEEDGSNPESITLGVTIILSRFHKSFSKLHNVVD
jgi:hypothetical protein